MTVSTKHLLYKYKDPQLPHKKPAWWYASVVPVTTRGSQRQILVAHWSGILANPLILVQSVLCQEHKVESN